MPKPPKPPALFQFEEPDWSCIFSDEIEIAYSHQLWRVYIDAMREMGTVSTENLPTLQRLADAVEQGASGDDAAESMLTVAVTGLMRLHGPRHVAQRLLIVAGMLTKLANDAAMAGGSDDRTRH